MPPDELGRERIIALVFGLLGVIQGLAFTKLAEKFPKTFSERKFSLESLTNIVFFLVGFLVVVRVFQTYASGIVEYAKTQMAIYDLYAIFIAGLMQYWVFDAFEVDRKNSREYQNIQGDRSGRPHDESTDLAVPVVNADKIFTRVAFLSVFAIILHLLPTIQEIAASVSTRTQQWNIVLAGGILFSCLIANWVKNKYTDITFAIIICLMLFGNTWNSLDNTNFDRRASNVEKSK